MPYREGKKWRATVTYQGERHTALKNTKGEAQRWESETKKELKRNARKPRNGMDLLDFCGKYLDHARRFQPKVYGEKKCVCKRILEYFGPEKPVCEITPMDLQEFLNHQAQDRSNNASNKDRKNASALWNYGIKFCGLTDNPVAVTDKFPHDRKPQYTPPIEDVLRLLAAANCKERIFLECYLQTGARRSEIYRLIWEDVDFNRDTIRLGTRKTRDGSLKYRTLALSNDLKQSLEWWWQNRTFKRSPYVFVDDQPGPHYGEPYKERRRFMRGLCKRAKVKPFGFHALRRFVASVLDSKNVPLKQIQLILGHQRPTTTDRYLANIGSDQSEIMNLISEKIHGHHTREQKRATPN